jgi:putative PIN family toxin of toxin-antitoxin system
MRVLFDTNILVSYLLSTSVMNTAVSDLIAAAVEGRFTIVLPSEVVSELESKVANKRYLRANIADADVARLLAILRIAGESLPPQTGVAPALVRDPKDNFLLVAAAAGNVDVLVTGDLDLLVLRDRLKRPAIMRAAEFLEMIESGSSD